MYTDNIFTLLKIGQISHYAVRQLSRRMKNFLYRILVIEHAALKRRTATFSCHPITARIFCDSWLVEYTVGRNCLTRARNVCGNSNNSTCPNHEFPFTSLYLYISETRTEELAVVFLHLTRLRGIMPLVFGIWRWMNLSLFSDKESFRETSNIRN